MTYFEYLFKSQNVIKIRWNKGHALLYYCNQYSRISEMLNLLYLHTNTIMIYDWSVH